MLFGTRIISAGERACAQRERVALNDNTRGRSALRVVSGCTCISGKPRGFWRSRADAPLDPIHRRSESETYRQRDVIHIRCQRPRAPSSTEILPSDFVVTPVDTLPRPLSRDRVSRASSSSTWIGSLRKKSRAPASLPRPRKRRNLWLWSRLEAGLRLPAGNLASPRGNFGSEGAILGSWYRRKARRRYADGQSVCRR